MRRWAAVAAGVVVLSLVGCETAYDLPRSKTSGDSPPWAKDVAPGVERWECGDYFDGCGLFPGDCVTLTANVHEGSGEVTLGEHVEFTRFEVQGIERRWDWCLNDDFRYDCLFVISVDGRGRYYNFRSVDGPIKPTGLFKCTRE